jgi:uncharacterized RDD family membrane protein YckC
VPDRPSGRHTDLLPTAGYARRLLCLLYEGLLLTGVAFGATFALLLGSHLIGATVPRTTLQVYLLIVGGCYFVPQWRAGRTLPMKTWRIQLVGVANGQLTTQRALIRYGFALMGWLLAGAGYLWPLVDRDGQFLHDRLAGTRLVSAPRHA